MKTLIHSSFLVISLLCPLAEVHAVDQVRNLTTVALAADEIRLDWDSLGGVEDVHSYRIERRDSPALPFVQIGENFGTPGSFPLTPGPPHSFYTDFTAEPDHEYCYQIISTDDGDVAPPSTPSCATTPPGIARPADFLMEVLDGPKIRVSWPAVDGARGYELDVRYDGNPEFELLVSLDNGEIEYVHDPLPVTLGCTIYYYRVRTKGSLAVRSAYQSASFVTLPDEDSPPRFLTARSSSPAEAITLRWELAPCSRYVRVEHSLSPTGPFAEIAFVERGDGSSFRHFGREPGQANYYRAKGVVFRDGVNVFSAPLEADVFPAYFAPGTPANVAGFAISESNARINWSQVEGEDGYEVEMSSGGAFQLVGETVADDVTLAVDGLSPNVTYSFRVRARLGSVYSPYVGPEDVRMKPAPVMSVVASANGSGSVRVAWSVPEFFASDGFRLLRAPGENPQLIDFVEIAQPGDNVLEHFDSGLSAGETFTFRVVNVFDGRSSLARQSNAAAVAPAPPGGLVAEAASSSAIVLDWDDVPVAIAYRIERRLASAFRFAVVGEVAESRFVDSGLVEQTTYEYRVSSVGLLESQGSPSAVASATTQVRLLGTAEGTDGVRLNWEPFGNGQVVRILRSTNFFSGYAQVGTLGMGASTFLDTGLPQLTRFFYKLEVVDGAGGLLTSEVRGVTTGLTAPAGLTGELVPPSSAGELTKIVLNWDAVTNASSYDIERSEAGGDWAVLKLKEFSLSFTDTELAFGKVYFYRVSSRASSGVVSAPSDAVEVANLSVQAAWRLSFFGNPANAGDAARLADPDGDGQVNLLEYLLGTSPIDGSDFGHVEIESIELGGGAGWEVRSFILSGGPNTTEVDWQIEASSDLLSWIPHQEIVGVEIVMGVVPANGMRKVAVRLPDTPGQPVRFFRITAHDVSQ